MDASVKAFDVDTEKEKKKNIRLAIGVAALCIIGLVLFYSLICAAMFLRPGLFFSMLPIPALSRDIVSLDGRLYVISREADPASFSTEEKRSPKEKFSIGVLSGGKIADRQEISPFSSVVAAPDRAYFLDSGILRTFDGRAWDETRSDVIGKEAKGAASPDGLYLLSKTRAGYELFLLSGSEALPIALPGEFLADVKSGHFCSSRLVWFQGRLFLFWPVGEAMSWSHYDGSSWSRTEQFEYSGTMKVIADEKRIYLFNEQFSEHGRDISYIYYDNGSWSSPVELGIRGLFLDWSVFLHKGNPSLFVRNFFSEELHTVRDSSIEKTEKVGGSFFSIELVLKIAALSLASTFVFFLSVYLLSVLVNRFKLRTWKSERAEYEFASIFRRFSAKTIDSVVIALPVAAILSCLAARTEFWTNPLNIILVVFLSAGYVLVGGFLYHSVLEGILGWTLGKRACGIVVLKDDFTRCGLLAGFLRNVMRIVDSFFYNLVGLVSITGTLRWQRLGDIVAGTVVVRRNKS